MQKLFFFSMITLLMVGFAQRGQAQQLERSKVPAAVVSIFEEEHPDARKVKWYQNQDRYLVEFLVKDKEGEALYGPDGKLVVLELEIDWADLPKRALQYLGINFSDYEILEADLERTDQLTIYEVEVKVEGQEIELLFDENGNFLKKETKEDD